MSRTISYFKHKCSCGKMLIPCGTTSEDSPSGAIITNTFKPCECQKSDAEKEIAALNIAIKNIKEDMGCLDFCRFKEECSSKEIKACIDRFVDQAREEIK